MALLHELAHIRRHDNLVTLLQRLAESLLFFHPVTWWLSAWVSLERELCCDRLVVEHTGRPHDYARMLAALAGAGPGAQSMALAMAGRPLTTRIRRILDMEDRSMKMTLTEGLGLLAAAIVGTALTLAAHAGPPEPVPADAARQALERLAQAHRRDAGWPRTTRTRVRPTTARACPDRDRAGPAQARRPRRGARDAPPARRPGRALASEAGGEGRHSRVERFAALAESAGSAARRGRPRRRRAALDRAARDLDVLDRGAVRGAIDRVGKEIDDGARQAGRRRPPAVDRRGSRARQRGVDRPDRSVHRPGRHGPGPRR